MPDSGDGIPDGQVNGDIPAAWEAVHEARRKRKTMHDLVRQLRTIRVDDDFADRIRDSMSPRDQQP